MPRDLLAEVVDQLMTARRERRLPKFIGLSVLSYPRDMTMRVDLHVEGQRSWSDLVIVRSSLCGVLETIEGVYSVQSETIDRSSFFAVVKFDNPEDKPEEKTMSDLPSDEVRLELQTVKVRTTRVQAWAGYADRIHSRSFQALAEIASNELAKVWLSTGDESRPPLKTLLEWAETNPELFEDVATLARFRKSYAIRS